MLTTIKDIFVCNDKEIRLTSQSFSVPSPSLIRKIGVHTKRIAGQETLVAGDRPFWGFIYTFDPIDHLPYLKSLESMYNQGVRIFSFILPLPVTWKEEGGYDFSLIDELCDKILEAAPDGLLIPRVFMNTPDWWDHRNPEEILAFRGPKPQIKQTRSNKQSLWQYGNKITHDIRNPSITSEKWRKDASLALEAYVKHTWQGQYAGHFIGYQVAFGTCGEWGDFGSYINNQYGSYDWSPSSLKAFRTYLHAKYGSDENLVHAWMNSSVTLETAEPPTKIETLKTDLGVFKNPQYCQHYVDWVEHYSHQKNSAIIHFAKTVKTAAPVEVLAGVFSGAKLQTGCSAYISQCVRNSLNVLLDSPFIDFLSTPNNYHNRRKGIFSQAPIQTISHRKMFISECDIRTYDSQADPDCTFFPQSSDQNAFFFKRDTFFSLTQGSGHLWWYDFGKGWYLDPLYMSIIKTLVHSMETVSPADRAGQAEVAVVIDEQSLYYTEGSSGYYNLFRQLLNQSLPRFGSPFDIITTDDMLDRPPYKLYIMRDLWYADEERIHQIRNFLETNGSSCVWFYANGMLGKDGIDPDQIQKLTGIQLKVIETVTSHQVTISNPNHPITCHVPITAGTSGNEDLRGVYSPVLYVDDPQAEILGHLESLHLPGIAYKRQAIVLTFGAQVPSCLRL
jgi:hypothetical protein